LHGLVAAPVLHREQSERDARAIRRLEVAGLDRFVQDRAQRLVGDWSVVA